MRTEHVEGCWGLPGGVVPPPDIRRRSGNWQSRLEWEWEGARLGEGEALTCRASAGALGSVPARFPFLLPLFPVDTSVSG